MIHSAILFYSDSTFSLISTFPYFGNFWAHGHGVATLCKLVTVFRGRAGIRAVVHFEARKMAFYLGTWFIGLASHASELCTKICLCLGFLGVSFY